MVTKEQFLTDANKCWNDILKKDMTLDEKEYAWNLMETEFLSKKSYTHEELHKRAIGHLSKTITLNGISIFNWVMSKTFKSFHLGPVKESN